MSGDLNNLNSVERLDDGSVPLRTWLENAREQFATRVEAKVFAKALDGMKAHSEPRSDTTAIVDGLKALSVLIKKTAPANEAFVIYGNAFHMARDDIDVIADYKLLHEELHQMELAWPPDIGPTVNSLSGNPNSQMLVRRHSANLRRAVAQLRAIFTKGNVDRDESKWIDNFDQLQQELEQAISAGQVADRIDL